MSDDEQTDQSEGSRFADDGLEFVTVTPPNVEPLVATIGNEAALLLRQYNYLLAKAKGNDCHDADGRFCSGGGGTGAAGGSAAVTVQAESSGHDASGWPPDDQERSFSPDEGELRELDQWAEQATGEQQAMIEGYMEDSSIVNEALANPTSSNLLERQEAAEISRMIDEFGSDLGGKHVYRGIAMTETTLFVSKVKRLAGSDKPLTLNRVTSTSLDPAVAMDFALKDRPRLKSVVLEIKPKKALYLGGRSEAFQASFGDEREAIMRPSSQYKVSRVAEGFKMKAADGKQHKVMLVQLQEI